MRRLLLVKKNKSYLASATPPVQEGAFHPRKDEAALSLSRRRTSANPTFLTEWQFKVACRYGNQTIAATCGVCAFPAEFAMGLGIEIRPDPIHPDGPGEVVLPGVNSDPGHAGLPGINWKDWHEETGTSGTRERIRLWISELVVESSQYILIEPGTPRSANPAPQAPVSTPSPEGQLPQDS